MKSIFAIVYSPINSVSQERLNLGMIMLNEFGEVSFKYSQEKLNSVKKLFSDDAYKLIKSYLSSIQQKLDDKGDLIDNLADFKSEYLTYLSNYSHNLVAFTKPQSINLELTESNFNKLFEKYIFKMPQEILHKIAQPSNLKVVKEEFISRVQKRVNINVELKADKFDFVIFNLLVDMMGKNDKPVLNQFVDFNVSPSVLEKKIISYISIIKPFELKDGTGKFFLVGDEPTKETPKQHLIWKHLHDSPLISEKILEVIPSNEISRVEEYLVAHDVRPYFEN